MTKKRSKRNKPNTKITKRLAAARMVSGPLPPAEELHKYELIQSGAADRILRMAEKQSNHRIDIEDKVVQSNINNSKLGLICGLIIGMTAIIGGVVCSINGQPWAGAFIGCGGVTGLVSVFVYGKKQNIKELRVKRQLQQNQ